MTTPQQNTQTVLAIYEAFGRGDVPAILARLHPDVEWEFSADQPEIPWLRAGRGLDAAISFFETVARELEFERFEVLGVMGDGPWVTGLLALQARVRRTGKVFVETGEVHIWRFDAEGRITGMRHAADTLAHWRALQPG